MPQLAAPGRVHGRDPRRDPRPDPVEGERPSLPAAESLARSALEAAGAGAWECRPDDGAVVWSPAMFALHGLDAHAAQPDLAAWRALIHPDDRGAAFEPTRDDGALERQYRVLHADGQERWLTARGRQVGGEGGPRRLVGVSLDVTAAKRAEEAERRAAEARHRSIIASIDQMIWSTRPDGHHDYFNPRWYEFTGVPEGATDGEAWNGLFHPDDQDRAWERWRRSLATGEPYQIEYRLRHRSGQYRWVLCRAHCERDAAGRIERWYGTCTDIHDARTALEINQTLSRELNHRIKNVFAIVSGLIAQAVRGHPEARGFAMELRERVVALSRAHELVRPGVSDDGRSTDNETGLADMLAALLSPYGAWQDGRVTIQGPNLPVDDRAATPIALVIHELATNAAKYGALSVADGRVDVAIDETETAVTLTWRESGGPAIGGEPSEFGFGSKLIDISVRSQLGGRIETRWEPGGLVVVATVRPERLRRAAATRRAPPEWA